MLGAYPRFRVSVLGEPYLASAASGFTLGGPSPGLHWWLPCCKHAVSANAFPHGNGVSRAPPEESRRRRSVDADQQADAARRSQRGVFSSIQKRQAIAAAKQFRLLVVRAWRQVQEHRFSVGGDQQAQAELAVDGCDELNRPARSAARVSSAASGVKRCIALRATEDLQVDDPGL